MDISLAYRLSEIRSKVRAGQVSIGTWLQLCSADVAEIVAWGGFDWIAIDMEHGSIDISDLPDIVRAISAGGSVPLVRLAIPCPSVCARALDAGACGIIAPRIETVEQAIGIRDATRWPPSGARGVGFSRANQYGQRFRDEIGQPEPPLVVLMIESSRALENIDSISEVAGVDSLFVGPYDLSASLGRPGDFDHDDFRAALTNVKSACVRAETAAGFHSVSPSETEVIRAVEAGFTFVAYGTDAVFLSANAIAPKLQGYDQL